jgi:hypothetical protein
MKFLLVLLLAVGCGDVHGTPFGDEPLGSGGAAGSVASGTGGSAGAPTVLTGSGGSPAAIGATGGVGGAVATATGGIGGAAPVATGGSSVRGVVYVESLPMCPDYVTAFGSPITSSRFCGISSDNHLLYGCVGVVRQGIPTDSTPCQFTDPNNAYNGSSVFGCVDAQGC